MATRTGKRDGCALHFKGCTGTPDHMPVYLDHYATACSNCHEIVCREKDAEVAEVELCEGACPDPLACECDF